MDWIKVETCLAQKPEVLQMARMLAIPIPHVVGLLVVFWSWAGNVSSNGVVTHVSRDDIDVVTAHPGCASALAQVGWLKCDDATGQVSIPHFDRHNGQSAKKRALNAERQAAHRSKSRNAPVVCAVTHTALPEKIREDINPLAQNAPRKRVAKPAHIGFDAFWRLYPRKLDKVKALKAWNALNADETLRNRIFDCLQTTTWHNNPNFIPYPASWINGKRWLDEGPSDPQRGLVL